MEYTTEVINITKIKEGFFIGDQLAGTNIYIPIQFKISHMINAAGFQLPNLFEQYQIKYLTLNWAERASQNLFDPKDRIVDTIVFFIDNAVNKGEGLLVYSVKGQNRTCCVVIIYLIKKYNWTVNKCLDFLQSKKKDVNIPNYFLEQLYQFELRCNKNKISSDNWIDNSFKDKDEEVMKNTYVNGYVAARKIEDVGNKKKNNKKIGWGDRTGKNTGLIINSNSKDLYLQKNVKNVDAHLRLNPGKSCFKTDIINEAPMSTNHKEKPIVKLSKKVEGVKIEKKEDKKEKQAEVNEASAKTKKESLPDNEEKKLEKQDKVENVFKKSLSPDGASRHLALESEGPTPIKSKKSKVPVKVNLTSSLQQPIKPKEQILRAMKPQDFEDNYPKTMNNFFLHNSRYLHNTINNGKRLNKSDIIKKSKLISEDVKCILPSPMTTSNHANMNPIRSKSVKKNNSANSEKKFKLLDSTNHSHKKQVLLIKDYLSKSKNQSLDAPIHPISNFNMSLLKKSNPNYFNKNTKISIKTSKEKDLKKPSTPDPIKMVYLNPGEHHRYSSPNGTGLSKTSKLLNSILSLEKGKNSSSQIQIMKLFNNTYNFRPSTAPQRDKVKFKPSKKAGQKIKRAPSPMTHTNVFNYLSQSKSNYRAESPMIKPKLKL